MVEVNLGEFEAGFQNRCGNCWYMTSGQKSAEILSVAPSAGVFSDLNRRVELFQTERLVAMPSDGLFVRCEHGTTDLLFTESRRDESPSYTSRAGIASVSGKQCQA